jgi:hypothetical protein
MQPAQPGEGVVMRRSKMWWAAAVFTFINAAGAAFAELMGDSIAHTGTHLVLTFVGGYFVWRLVPKPPAAALDAPALASGGDDRMAHLEQSIDAVAIEVERLGESQRYMARLVEQEGPPAEPAKKSPLPNVRRD